MYIREADSWCPECGCEVTHVVEHVKYKVEVEYHVNSTEYEYKGTEPQEIQGMVPYVVGIAPDKHSLDVKVMCSNQHEWTAECFIDETEKDRQKDLLAGATDVPPPKPVEPKVDTIAPGFAGEVPPSTQEPKLLN